MKHNAGSLPNIDHDMSEDKWKDIAEKLWILLDDIDTASDMFKPKKDNFYRYSMKKAEKRFELISSDGYDLFPVKRKTK